MMSRQSKTYYHTGWLDLERGGHLIDPQIKYTTYGSRKSDDSNVVWILHALTANDDPMQWWPGIVGPGCVIDTDYYYVVCASMIGGHYGSTNPLSVNPDSGEVYYDTFPLLTNRDIVTGFELLRQHLGIGRIHCMVGSSLGGQQALEWLIRRPDLTEKAVLIATNAVHSPWAIAFNESQRMAIAADQTYGSSRPDAGQAGLAAARSIALLSYRTAEGYNQTQKSSDDGLGKQRAASYQRYQGAKLVQRYNAYSYYRLTQAMDSHHIGRDRGDIDKVLQQIKAITTIVGITSDILFPIAEQRRLQEHIPASTMYEIDSDLGHDGFLVEAAQMSKILHRALRQASVASL